MRVADGYCLQSALGHDEVDSGLVEQRRAVPEYVSSRSLEENGALADAELFAYGAKFCKAYGKLGRY